MNLKKNYLIIGITLMVLMTALVFLRVKNARVEAEWLNYILEQDIQEITLTRNLDGDKRILNLDDLKRIFRKLDNYGTKRVFSEIITDESKYTLAVYYLINEDGHYLIVNDDKIDVSNDNNLINLINEDYWCNEYDKSATDETQTYYFAFDDYKDYIFAKYFE